MKTVNIFSQISGNVFKTVFFAAALLSAKTEVSAQNVYPSSGNVGIGTASPGYPLDVQGTNFWIARFRNKGGGAQGSALIDIQNSAGAYWRVGIGGTANGLGLSAGQFYFEKDGVARVTFGTTGNVGIGTSAPSYRLHVNSPDVRAFQIDGNNTAWTGFYVNNTTTTGQPFMGLVSNNGSNYAYQYLTPAGDWRLYVSGDRLTVTKAGNVGIGTLTPSAYYKLSVNGSIRAKEVVVESGWADFVFDKGYKLKTLEEVESYISENKHLPDVPSAKEVQANGVKIGEVQTTLLQKIEELTLYAIEAQKQIHSLQTKVKTLESSSLK